MDNCCGVLIDAIEKLQETQTALLEQVRICCQVEQPPPPEPITKRASPPLNVSPK